MDFSTPEGKRLRRKYIIMQVTGLVLFFIGVAACYQGAIREKLWLGPAIVIATCALQVLVAIRRWQKEILIILSTGIAGLILETILTMCGVYSVVEKTRWIFPAPVCVEWILALWLNFGARTSGLLPGVRGKPIMVAGTAAVFGMLIFRRAAKLGLLHLTWGWWSIAAISAAWAVVVPLLFMLAGKLIPPMIPPAGAPSPIADPKK